MKHPIYIYYFRFPFIVMTQPFISSFFIVLRMRFRFVIL